jgi:DNA polymerase III epsilon subunit family exonuclease
VTGLREAVLGRETTDATYVVLDLEMTGLDPEHDQICEIGLVRLHRGVEVDRFHTLVRPTVPMTPTARRIHRISDEALADAPFFGEVAQRLRGHLDDAVLVGHHIDFDLRYLRKAFADAAVAFEDPPTVDTLALARGLLALRSHRLGAICAVLGVDVSRAHRALDDALATAACFQRMAELLDLSEVQTVEALVAHIELLAPDSSLRASQLAVLEAAHEARRTVHIEYLSRLDEGGYEVTSREVEIWKLAAPRFQRFCRMRAGERVFRLERVRRVVAGEGTYDIPPFRERI